MNPRRRMHDELPSRRIAAWFAAYWGEALAWACLAVIFGLAAFGLHTALAGVA